MKILKYVLPALLLGSATHNAAAQSLQQYALELSQSCSMEVYDQDSGVHQGVTEPAGYVTTWQWWQGAAADLAQGNAQTPPNPSFSSLSPALDPCGHAWNPVLVVNGLPAGGSGGTALVVAPAVASAYNLAVAQATYASLVTGGLTITSTGSPAVNGTYGVQPSDTANLNATETYILANGSLQQTPEPWFLTNGSEVLIPSVTVFKNISSAIANFITSAHVAEGIAAAGGTPSWPSASVTIP